MQSQIVIIEKRATRFLCIAKKPRYLYLNFYKWLSDWLANRTIDRSFKQRQFVECNVFLVLVSELMDDHIRKISSLHPNDIKRLRTASVDAMANAKYSRYSLVWIESKRIDSHPFESYRIKSFCIFYVYENILLARCAKCFCCIIFVCFSIN